MDRTNIDKEQVQNLMKEVLAQIGEIKNASETYGAMIAREYEDSNLHFLKVLSDLFGTDDKQNGIGAQALHLAELCEQANAALKDYFKETDSL